MSDRATAEHCPLAPYRVTLEADRRYLWCACGYSRTQPFCDFSHKNLAPDVAPLTVRLDQTLTVAVCGCKMTANPPFCDGTHACSDTAQAPACPAPPPG